MSDLVPRTNPVDHPVHELVRLRWSPVAFRDDEPVTDEELRSIFEAARWAASCFNAQPWRFVIARKGHGDDHARLVSCLAEANQTWAKHAPVLMFVVARRAFEHNEKPNEWAWHDCGQALAHIMLQATHHGLFAHAMAGFDADEAREAFSIEEGFDPVCAVAIGHRGNGSQLPEDTRERDQGERKRKKLADVLFEGRFGRTTPLLGG